MSVCGTSSGVRCGIAYVVVSTAASGPSDVAWRSPTRKRGCCMFCPTRCQKRVMDCWSAARVVVTRPAAAETIGPSVG